MSIDERIQRGLAQNGDAVPVAVESSLETVVRRHRSAFRRRVAAFAIAAAMVLALAPWGFARLTSEPQPAGPSKHQLTGTFVVRVPASVRPEMAGRWVVTFEPGGALRVVPPPDQAVQASTDAWDVRDGVLETNADVGFGCQYPGAGIKGLYTWERTATTLTFHLVEDRCSARRALFAVPWREQQ
jgi:hypothetical protein